jgi:hypothetical protein
LPPAEAMLVTGALAWLTARADALEPAVVADLHAAVGHLLEQPAPVAVSPVVVPVPPPS